MNIRRLQCFFSARSCSTSLSEICGTQGRASRKRLKLGVKPLISLILIIGILFSFSVSSYADNSITYRLADFQLLDITDTPSVFSTQDIGGATYTSVGYYSADEGKLSLFYKLSNELKAGDSYTISFNVFRATGMDGFSEVYFALSDSPTQFENSVNIASFSTSEISKGGSQRFSIQFTYPEDKFNGKQCYILCSILSPKGYSLFYLSDIVFTNNNQTDDKIDGILEWLSAVYHSIVGGEDSRGVKHDGLVQGIKNGLTSLGNTIGGFFENLKISIENKIDAIQQWFVELGENIIDGIKSLFIPEDGYFESKKAELETFFSEHFGIVYTAGSLSIDVLKKFTSLKPPAQAVLHVPAWQMSLPWENDKVITIVPAMDVNFSEYINSSGVLHNFYKFYRAFITVVIIFMVVNYAKRKFDYVFGKDGEGVE